MRKGTRTLATLALASLLLCISLVSVQAEPAAAQEASFFAFYPWAGADSGEYDSFAANAEKIGYVAPLWYRTNDGLGNIEGTVGDTALLSLARSRGAKVLPNLYNWSPSGWSQPKVHQLLSTPANRTNLVNNIKQLVRSNGFDGITLDLENLAIENRGNYSELVRELGAALRGDGKKLALAVPAKTSDSVDNTWTYPFHYEDLANNADLIVVMAYDEHWTGADPGPVASIGFIRNVVGYAAATVPAAKLVIALPFYGYDFTTGPTPSKTFLGFESVEKLRSSAGSSAAFHEEDRVPYFTYHDAKGYHEVWYENVRSFREKQAVITASGAKTGAFVLGFEDPGVWAEIPSVPVSDPKNFDITEPKDGATVTGPFTLRLSASQDLSEVKILVDGLLTAIMTSAPYQINLGVSHLSPGTHEIRAEGRAPGQTFEATVTFAHSPGADSTAPNLFRPQTLEAEASGVNVSGTEAPALPQQPETEAPAPRQEQSLGEAWKPDPAETPRPTAVANRNGVEERREPGSAARHQLLFSSAVLFLMTVLRTRIFG